MFSFVLVFNLRPLVMDFNEKQIQILKVAEKLFAEIGFDGTSVRHIAKEADVNVAMISYYFGSKEKLLEALLLYRVADFKMELETVMVQNLPHVEKLDALVSLMVNRIHRNRRTHKIINYEYTNTCRQIDFDAYVEQKRDSLGIIEAFVKDGQNKGVFKTDVHTKLLGATVIGTYFQVYNNKPFYKKLLELDSDEAFENYMLTSLTQHIQQTIKSLLLNEK